MKFQGPKLRKLRKLRGLTLEALAAKIISPNTGLPILPSTISRWETGQAEPITSLIPLANALGVESRYFYHKEGKVQG